MLAMGVYRSSLFSLSVLLLHIVSFVYLKWIYFPGKSSHSGYNLNTLIEDRPKF